jgi:hypothetical protein
MSRASMRDRIRWQAVASLVGLVVVCGLLAYEGVRWSRLDLAAIGAGLVVLSAMALAFGREPTEQGD